MSRTPAPSPLLVTGIAGVAAATAAATVWVSATSDVLASPEAAPLRGFIVFTWMLVGLRTWERRPASRFGPLLIFCGLLYSLTTLSAIDAAVPFTLGALMWPVVVVAVSYTALAFPTGRLTRHISSRLVAAMAAGSAVMWGLLLLGAASVPTVAGPQRCDSGCPSNPFRVVDFGGALTDVVERGAIAVLAVGTIGVAIVFASSLRGATASARRVLGPPAAVLFGVIGGFVVGAVLRVVTGDNDVAVAATWISPAIGALFPVAVLVGQSRARLFAPAALADMVAGMPAAATRPDLEATMAQALGDPSLRLAYRVGRGGYTDGAGLPVAVPRDAPDRVTEIRDDTGVVAVIVHDPVLEEPAGGVVEDAGTAVRLALENARLEAEVLASERDLRESRARLLAAGMKERRRLERDLHDTAQQRLIMLRMRLDLADDETGEDAEEIRLLLDRLGEDVEETIDTVRDIAHGLYPSLLADQGLGAALRAAARRGPYLTALDVGELGRSRPEVEAALFLCCRDALQALGDEPGAGAGTRLVLRLGGSGLQVLVGGPGPGGSLVGQVVDRLGDPVAALGGSTDAVADDAGWSVAADVPWPAREAAAQLV